MSNEAIKNFLDGFSIEVTPRAAAKIDNFAELIPKGTLIYVAHIEGTPIEEQTQLLSPIVIIFLFSVLALSGFSIIKQRKYGSKFIVFKHSKIDKVSFSLNKNDSINSSISEEALDAQLIHD